MTFILTNRYPDRANGVDQNHPRGSFKNRSSAEENDGSYLEQDWGNDDRAFPDRLLKEAGITPNGNVDDASNSQVYQAFVNVVQRMIADAIKPSEGASVPLYAVATGGANNITATFIKAVPMVNGQIVYVRAQYANTVASPTFSPNGQPAKAIVKGNGISLRVGDIAGAGHVLQLIFDSRFDRWILLNPAFGVNEPVSIPVGTLAFMGTTVAPAGWLRVDGGEYSRSQYANLVNTCPQFITAGSNANTFRFIDLRGYFIRCLDSGHGVDPDAWRGLGSNQGDAIRNITGTFDGNSNDWNGAKRGAFYMTSEAYSGSDGNKGGGVIGFDASRVVPVASENRPKNVALPLFIKY